MFFGREQELDNLASLWLKRAPSLVVCSGRRRIGKSTLVEEFASRSKCRFIEIAGLAPDEGVDNEKQLRNFCERLAAQTGLPEARVDGWAKAFDALFAAVGARGRIVVLLDEISWMGAFDKGFAAYLKNAWDMQFSKRDGLVLVLCGSVSSWIKKNILMSKAFVGRVSMAISLEELPLAVCRRFWGNAADRTPIGDVVEFLSVTGGVPKYLSELRPSLSADENIRRLCFSKGGYLFDEFDRIFTDIFRKTADEKGRMVELLCEGPKSVKTLAAALGCSSNGHLSDALGELCEAGFLSSDNGLNPSTGREVREVHYRVSDNYVRFYLKYIKPRANAIKKGSLESMDVSRLPGWDSMLGIQFECLVRNNLRRLLSLIGMGSAIVTSAAPYVVRGGRRGEGIQIDLLVQTSKSVCVVEIKRKSFMGPEVEDEVQEKIRRLNLPRAVSVRTALVYMGTISAALEESGYFDFLVPVERLFE